MPRKMKRGKTLLISYPIAVLALVGAGFGQNPTPVTDPTGRLEFQGFSVLPPSGKDWFVVEPKSFPDPSAETVQFAKVVGRMHSLYGMAMLVAPAATQTLDNLRSLVLEEAKRDPRFKPLKTETSLDKCFGYDCVRFDLLLEEHAPADFPGIVLMITRRGFAVPHPGAPGSYIWVEYSERFQPGTKQYPLDAELEPFLKSVQFTPIRRTYTFPNDCKLPRGDTDIFSYGCEQGAYRMRLKKPGPVHVTGELGLNAQAVSLEVDAAVTSGLGTEPGKAMIGIGCLAGPQRGYVALVKTNGTAGIVRFEGNFIPLTGSNHPGDVSLPGPTVRLRISCVGEREKGKPRHPPRQRTESRLCRGSKGLRSVQQLRTVRGHFPGPCRLRTTRGQRAARVEPFATSRERGDDTPAGGNFRVPALRWLRATRQQRNPLFAKPVCRNWRQTRMGSRVVSAL